MVTRTVDIIKCPGVGFKDLRIALRVDRYASSLFDSQFYMII